ncbi:M56 family metallopeptidase [Brevundimonas sp.]
MAAQDLLALALLLSVATSVLAWASGALVERVSGDPSLRDRAWGAGLVLSALPPLAVALLVLTPAPIREIAAPVVALAPVLEVATPAVEAGPATQTPLDLNGLVWLVLTVALVAALVRMTLLGLRTLRLARTLAAAEPADEAIARRVSVKATALRVVPPRIAVSATTSEALLSGLGRACLILPASAADDAALDAVIAHELAHLKRGDHRTLWLEEALSVLLAANPMIPILRARRDAAREEACDALALIGASPAARRAYAQTLINALRDRAGPAGGGGLVALTFTGAGRTTAMHRLKAVMTPAAPAGPRARWIAALGALGLVAVAGGATAALAGRRAPEIRVLPPVTASVDQDGDMEAQQATRAALATLPPEARARFQRASASDYQMFCASADETDEGFCVGVMFAHVVDAPGNGLCVPEGGDANTRLEGIVARGKAEIARLAPRRDEGAVEYAERALKVAYPCGSDAATSTGLPDRPALIVRIGQTSQPLILGSRYTMRVALQNQDGERETRNTTRLEFPIVPDQPLEREVVFALKEEQLPTLLHGQTYELTAEIRDIDGRIVYAAEPVSVRMAPGSRGRLAGMRPELLLGRIAPASPSVSARTYQALVTISENGRVASSQKARLSVTEGAVIMTDLADRDYRFDLSMSGPHSDPQGEGRLTVRIDVGREGAAGGWEPTARPSLFMRPDGTARMSWGDDAGLMFDIVVEPA